MMILRRSRHPGGGNGWPALLPLFFAGTVVMVLAVVAMAHLDNDWADAGAVLVLVAIAGLLLLAIGRQMTDENDSDEP